MRLRRLRLCLRLRRRRTIDYHVEKYVCATACKQWHIYRHIDTLVFFIQILFCKSSPNRCIDIPYFYGKYAFFRLLLNSVPSNITHTFSICIGRNKSCNEQLKNLRNGQLSYRGRFTAPEECDSYEGHVNRH